MELIIKIKETCDWKCSFCSSSNITDDKSEKLDIHKIFKFLKRFPDTSTIIVNGGEPLIIEPEYYWNIINYIESNNLKTTLSFTSNLWNFYNYPEKWIKLFKHPLVGVTTSFNYGNTRMISNKIPYTEKLFWKVSDKFMLLIGYRPDFISVINDENLDTAIDNVLLARTMGVECKLNYAMSSGRQSKPLILGKIYQVYMKLIELGLDQYEYNTKQLQTRLITENTTCPQNRKCDEGIRAFNPSGDYYSCGSIADDRNGHEINFINEMNSDSISTPLRNDLNLLSLKSDCLSCPLFKICNGCYKTIKDMKEHNLVEEHCSIMKAMEEKILKISK